MKRSMILATLCLSVMSIGTSFGQANIAHAASRASKQPTVKAIPLHGAINVRDLGGYHTRDGKTIKAHRLLRSAALDKLTSADKSLLVHRYHLATDIDLRTDMEMKAAPDVKIAHVRYLANPVFHQFDKTATPVQIDAAVMKQTYANFVTNSGARRAYHRLFTQLLHNTGKRAVLWHCSAGKDRAGMGTVLVLSALGVDNKTIMKDYLLSNRFRKTTNDQVIAGLKAAGKDAKTISGMQAALDVRPSYLQTSYRLIHQKYGTMKQFLKRGIGLSAHDLQTLRHLYLK